MSCVIGKAILAGFEFAFICNGRKRGEILQADVAKPWHDGKPSTWITGIVLELNAVSNTACALQRPGKSGLPRLRLVESEDEGGRITGGGKLPQGHACLGNVLFNSMI